MRKYRGFLLCSFLLILSLTVLGFTSSKGASQLQKDVNITSDTIDIRVIDKTVENMSIVPETIVDTNLYMQNAGAICYIRWKADVAINDIFQRQLNTDDFPGLDELWMYGGDGYYYRKTTFNEHERQSLFHQLRFPKELIDPLKEGDHVVITTTVQAIQSKNFRPGWQLAQPWKNQPIEKTIRSRMEVGQ